MLDLIKKSIYLGMGAATVTKEKIESLVDELIEKGQLKKEEKPGVVKDLMDKIEKEERELTDKIKSEIQKSIEELGLATKKDIDELNKKLKNLEKMLSNKES